MWLCLTTGFLSIVKPTERDLSLFDVDASDTLLVRARAAGHIEEVFPTAKVIETPSRDYRFRAFLPRARVATVISQHIGAIDYDNFKNAVEDDPLHNAYARVWTVMHNYQIAQLPPVPYRAGRRP